MILHADITDKILRSFYNVYNKLGYGFLETVYENSMIIECKKTDFRGVQQASIKVYYDGEDVGKYFADLLFENKVIVELKAGKGEIIKEHEMQLSNYLKATIYEVGLVLHFGEKPTFKRIALTNDYK
ncbi:MAG: GxxExxY protein [Ferruginibacter sp.]|nr:GxxExxY protein [Ferruginibacter sp.]